MNLGSVVIVGMGLGVGLVGGLLGEGADGLDLKAVGAEEADIVLNAGCEFLGGLGFVVERLDLDGELHLKEVSADDGLLPSGGVEAVAASVDEFGTLVEESLIEASGVGFADGSSVGSGERDEDEDGEGWLFHIGWYWVWLGCVR